MMDSASGPSPSQIPPMQFIGTAVLDLALYLLATLGLLLRLLRTGPALLRESRGFTVSAAVAWLVFAVLLWGRWKFGWRGRTAIRWTLGGFAFLLLAYFGSKLVLELVLGRHW
jgi:ABC-type uncharacterized transport system permease subunit